MISSTLYFLTASGMHSLPPTTRTPRTRRPCLLTSSSIAQTTLLWEYSLEFSSLIAMAAPPPAPMTIVRFCGVPPNLRLRFLSMHHWMMYLDAQTKINSTSAKRKKKLRGRVFFMTNTTIM